MENDSNLPQQPAPPTQSPALEAKRQLTFGEKAVGLTFNPGKLPAVENIKRLCAAAIDELNDQRNALAAPGREAHSENGEIMAQLTLAIRRIQEGQMWGVKAVTWTLDK